MKRYQEIREQTRFFGAVLAGFVIVFSAISTIILVFIKSINPLLVRDNPKGVFLTIIVTGVLIVSGFILQKIIPANKTSLICDILRSRFTYVMLMTIALFLITNFV